MGVRVNRIEKEFVFRKLLEKESLVRIVCRNIEINGKIKGFDDSYIHIEISPDDSGCLKEKAAISVFFLYENNQHTFNTRIYRIQGLKVTVLQPEKAYKDLKREYERLSSSGHISISFTIRGKRIQLDFPKTSMRRPLREPPNLRDTESPDIRELIRSFRESLASDGFENNITMLRNRPLSGNAEQILAKTGRILYVPNIRDGFLLRNEYPEFDILLYQHIKDYFRETGLAMSEAVNAMQDMLKNWQDQGILSVLYCPILFNEYVAGYIHVHTSAEKKGLIAVSTLKYVSGFADTLCYSLHKNRYFNAGQSPDHSYSTPVIDISASGLLFAHTDKLIAAELRLYANLDITLKIGQRKMEIQGEVRRKFDDERFSYIAVKYRKIAPEDFRFLYESIYGKPYSIESGFPL